MNNIRGVLETCLYATNLNEAAEFYEKILEFKLYSKKDGRHFFFQVGEGMFLLFNPEVTTIETGGQVAPHGVSGEGHVAFEVLEESIEYWRKKFSENGINIELTTEWPSGSISLYVRDPANNSVEITSRKTWELDIPNHFEIAKRIAAIAKTGLTFTEGLYDKDRYNELTELSLSLLSTKSDIAKDQLNRWFQSQSGYPTPKVDVRGAVIENNKILLAKEKEDGRWSMPGGWCDIHTSPKEAVEKELREETGLTVKAVKLVAVVDKRYEDHPKEVWGCYKMFFLCERLSGELKPDHEILELKFFGEDEIPKDLSLERITKKQIVRMFGYNRDKTKEVYFN